ncbi:SIS domain-containing protein [soil metagenome]
MTHDDRSTGTAGKANAAGQYFAILAERMAAIADTQLDAIETGAQACAASIAADGLVFSFGTGHGSFAALEMFPRTGTIAGFRSIVETSISHMHHIFGDMGTQQYRFLHTQEGFGHAILKAHRLADTDTMVLFSHSGMNPVILDMAVECRDRGMTVIGVTSVPHSSQVTSRHSSGLRLYEAADVTIDTGVQLADASITVPGLRARLGPTSTPLAVAVAHALVARTGEILATSGYEPKIMISPNTASRDEANANNDAVYEDLWRRLSSR